jgi:Leucine-rich repeat (LRR) protein
LIWNIYFTLLLNTKAQTKQRIDLERFVYFVPLCLNYSIPIVKSEGNMTQENQQRINEYRYAKTTQIDLSDCQLTDLSFLSEWTHLKVIFAGNNHITDLTPLANLRELSELYISNNKITDITALEGLIKLRVLQLQNNAIESVKPLSNLVNLLELDVSNNQLKDIRILSNLTNLEYLTVDNNPLDTSLKILMGRTNESALKYLLLSSSEKQKLVLNTAQDFIENGKLDTAIKLLLYHFKAENNKEVLLKIILLSQQLNEMKEKFTLGLIEIGYQKTEYARITQALLQLIWAENGGE